MYRRKTDARAKSGVLFQKARKRFFFEILLAAVVLWIGLSYAAWPFSEGLINNEKNGPFEAPWQYSVEGSAFEFVPLPSTLDVAPDACVTLKNQIPERMIPGETVLLRTSQQSVTVRVAGQVIYDSYNVELDAPAPSSAYHFVRLPMDSAGKEISVTLSSPYREYAGILNPIYIGSKSANLFFLIEQNGLRFILGFLVGALGLLLAVMFSLSKFHDHKAAITYLGAFFVCAGYWMMVESRLMQFFIPHPLTLSNASIFAVTLLPIFAGLYYYNIHDRMFQTVGKIMVSAAIAGSAAMAVCAWVNPRLPITLLPAYFMFLVVYASGMCACIVREHMKRGKLLSVPVLGVGLFGLCALVQGILYLVKPENYNQSAPLTVGMLLFSAMMVLDAVQNVAKVYQTADKVDALSVLAYRDSLTGLKNRAAFLERLAHIHEASPELVTLGMFDITGLKKVNDTLGHMAGDAMLRQSAKAIKASLRAGDEVYRIGGDEFVTVICHDQALTIRDLEQRLDDTIQSENQKPLGYVLSVAYGFATFTKDLDKTLFKTLARADAQMYRCKHAQKKDESGQ
ncbi:MAG: GGDEF domain-containing protein [Clostridia bacterium]